jgi:four helix bundle protein
MARVSRFEDLIAWQKARELARLVYKVTGDGVIARDYGLCGQLQRAAVTVMANIAEGTERMGVGDLGRFLSIAKGSCAEVRSHLYIAHDVGYLSDARFGELSALAEETGRVISGLRISVQRTDQDRS